MASFPPLKNYIFYCVDRLIDRYQLRPPFLDVGCGMGDTSRHLAEKGWYGSAIDLSPLAIEATMARLLPNTGVKIERKSLFDETDQFSTILALDIVEHIDNDVAAFKKIASLLPGGGYLIVTVPSNPREWRWDDEYFGHVRRYTVEEIKQKISDAGLRLVKIWDFTFPVFWLMRRAYTKLKHPPSNMHHDQMTRTKGSSLLRAWEIPWVSDLLAKDNVAWRMLYQWQFQHFRDRLNSGHEFIVLARKPLPK